MAIRVRHLTYELLICGHCGQIVRTDDAGKARRHMANDGKRRCKGSPAK